METAPSVASVEPLTDTPFASRPLPLTAASIVSYLFASSAKGLRVTCKTDQQAARLWRNLYNLERRAGFGVVAVRHGNVLDLVTERPLPLVEAQEPQVIASTALPEAKTRQRSEVALAFVKQAEGRPVDFTFPGPVEAEQFAKSFRSYCCVNGLTISVYRLGAGTVRLTLRPPATEEDYSIFWSEPEE